jgi:cytochrome b561
VVLHWTIVVLLILQYLEGEYMVGLWNAAIDGAPLTTATEVLGWMHIITGSTILAAALARLADRVVNGRPPYRTDEPAWAMLLAKVTHGAIYAILVAMPSLGLAAWISGVDRLAQLHTLLWTPLLVLIAVHVAGALVQHFHFKSDVLRRITSIR